MTEYAAGSCNIAGPEKDARRRFGWGGVVATLGLFAALAALDVDPVWRLVLVVPATAAAVGFLQARRSFCVAYGWRGVFNVDGPLGKPRRVKDPEAARADRSQAIRLSVQAALIGAVVAGVAFLLPL